MKLLSPLAALLLWGISPSSAQDDPHAVTDSIPAPQELDLSEISVGMGADDFEKREEAAQRLLEISRTRLPEVAVALFKEARTSLEPEVRFRSKSTFLRIFEFRVLGKGDANLGVDWHWHIQLTHQGEMRARPMVRDLSANSPAAKAGLKVGDIVCYVNEKELPRQTGLQTLRRILREAAPGEKLTFTVRNVQLKNKRATSKPAPNRKVTITVGDTKKGIRPAREGEFEKWYQNLKAVHDIVEK